MKKKLKNITFIIVILVASLMILTGCGEKEEDDNLDEVNEKTSVNTTIEKEDDLVDNTFNNETADNSSESDVVKRAEKAAKETEKALVKEEIELAIIVMQTNYLSAFSIDTSITREDFFTIKEFNNALFKNGYMICKNDNPRVKGNITDDKIPYGDVLYISKVTLEENDEDVMYEVVLEKNGSNIEIDNIEVIEY